MDGSKITSPRARIAWVSPEPDAASAAAPQFERAGYAFVDPEGAEPRDVAVVDLRKHKLPAKAAGQIARLTRQASPDCGIVYVGPVGLSASERAHLRRSGDLVLAAGDLGGAVEACRQRMRLRNLAEETGERLKSIAASTRLSEFPPIETASAAPTVLVAGAAGPSALAALAAVEKVARRTIGTLTAGQAMRGLESDTFDCAVLLPNADGDPLLGLARAMRRHRRLQDLPLIVIGGDMYDACRGRLAGANVADVLLEEHVTEDLGARVVAISRRARLAAAMRRFLSACAGDGVRDRLSGAFTPQFFAAHAERVFARAKETRRPLSVVALRLAPPASEDGESPSTRTLTDAARLINRVTRAEDFVARLSSDTFVVMLSSTVEADAAAAARRIGGVIANTMFRTRIDARPFAVAAAASALERAPGARVDETIAGVLARLNKATPRTAER